MSAPQINLVTRRVSASAEVRHVVSASIADPTNVTTLNVPARRGPHGPEGPPGPLGPAGPGIGDDNLVLDGGNF